jgi:hypothetical protein
LPELQKQFFALVQNISSIEVRADLRRRAAAGRIPPPPPPMLVRRKPACIPDYLLQTQQA